MTGQETRLEVYGRKTSSNVQVVMWAVGELGLDHVRHDVGGAFGNTDNSGYKAMNPMGLVPALKDDNLTLFESAAILRYLGAKYGDENFWPIDPLKRAKLDQWAEWTKTTVYPVLIGGIFWTLVRTKKTERNTQKLEQDIAQTGRLMSIAQTALGGQNFLGGDNLGFADIMFGHLLYRYYTLDFDRPDLSELEAYYERMTSRSAYREHVMVDYSSLRVE